MCLQCLLNGESRKESKALKPIIVSQISACAHLMGSCGSLGKDVRQHLCQVYSSTLNQSVLLVHIVSGSHILILVVLFSQCGLLLRIFVYGGRAFDLAMFM